MTSTARVMRASGLAIQKLLAEVIPLDLKPGVRDTPQFQDLRGGDEKMIRPALLREVVL
jgi:hypothetical protein